MRRIHKVNPVELKWFCLPSVIAWDPNAPSDTVVPAVPAGPKPSASAQIPPRQKTSTKVKRASRVKPRS